MNSSPLGPGGSAPISLAQVRKLFSRPERVAESDFLRREVAGRMFERLELIRVSPSMMLDAGCGEGADFELLQQRFPQAQLVGLDASEGMLIEAAQRQRNARSAMDRLLARLRPRAAKGGAASAAALICGDFAQLPVGPAMAGLIWSNLALHWHPQPDAVFVEWRRVLRAEGLLMFSCFGPDTFRELRSAAVESTGMPQVLPFVDMHDLGDMLVRAGFATPVMDMEVLTLTYDTAERLLADVRALGGNPLHTRSKGMAGRARLKHLYQTLESHRNADGKLTLTIEVIYGHAFCPVPSTTSSGDAILRFIPREQARKGGPS